MKTIDLRSDTVTHPSPEMLEAMCSADLGDDTLGDDPSVIHLEERIAEMTGMEAALLVPSGTMANLLALRSQTEPGDEIIAHKGSHIFHYEAGGYAAICGCSIQTIDTPKGIFTSGDARPLIRHHAPHYPRTRLVEIENTMNAGGGAVWPIEAVREIAEFARGHGLVLHMDGARIWNAGAALGLSISKITEYADSVSCCFSKGLGCPAGSALCASAETIHRARRFRKMFGGSMRQAGILAGAALYALEHNIERIADDHTHARLLADRLAELPGLTCDPTAVETNMVYFEVDPRLGTADQLCARLDARGVRMLAGSPTTIRAVCHLGVSREDIEHTGGVISEVATGAIKNG